MNMLEARKFDHMKTNEESSDVAPYDFGQFEDVKCPEQRERVN